MSKVVKITDEELVFDDGNALGSEHIQDCCESHSLYFKDLTMGDFEGLDFDLTSDTFFERLMALVFA